VPATLARLQARLTSGEVSSRELVEQCLERIADPKGEGARTFVRVFTTRSLADADASDHRRAKGSPTSSLDGLPLAVKDLFDIAGYTTLAGSVARAGDPPAPCDALTVARLRAAGAVVLGTTNMNEFALGTTGTNPHHGTPANPWDRGTGRCPGGSSSGCAVAVTDDLAAASVGTDTAGSVRVPSALCGLVGFKPTARRIPRDGVFPLSRSLDSVGCLGRSVACVAAVDAVLADDPAPRPLTIDLSGRRLALLTNFVRDDLDETVSQAYDAAITALTSAGAIVTELDLPPLERLPELCSHGGLSLYEAGQVHRERLRQKGELFDPLVASRLAMAEAITPARHAELLAERARLIADVAPLTEPFDALLMPTCPTVAPTLAEVADDQRWIAVNSRFVLCNIIANLLDRCALTLPCGRSGQAPVGLTMMGEQLGDAQLLTLGSAVEAALDQFPETSP